jgi:hypothetical protein
MQFVKIGTFWEAEGSSEIVFEVLRQKRCGNESTVGPILFLTGIPRIL